MTLDEEIINAIRNNAENLSLEQLREIDLAAHHFLCQKRAEQATKARKAYKHLKDIPAEDTRHGIHYHHFEKTCQAGSFDFVRIYLPEGSPEYQCRCGEVVHKCRKCGYVLGPSIVKDWEHSENDTAFCCNICGKTLATTPKYGS